MPPQQVTAEDVHNWSAPHVQARWRGLLTPEQRDAMTAAELRHHQRGTDAQTEANAINEQWSQMFDPLP